MTKCKNCTLEIDKKDNFCKSCGAQVIRKRITIKSLFSNLLGALGWDSNFIITLRYLFYKPQIVFIEYITGTRKKYANPFSLFAIITAISLLVFSHYSEQLDQMTKNTDFQQTGIVVNTSPSNIDKNNDIEFLESLFQFKNTYYNLFSFLSLPVYALIAFLVFGKPYNFGEHLVINAYILSITMLLSILLFLFSLIVDINLYGTGVLIITFIYYSFMYKRLYNLSFGQLLVKILKFIGIVLVLVIIIMSFK